MNEEKTAFSDEEEVREKKPLGYILFDVEGPVISFLTKAGELLLLSVFFLITCIPVVTVGPAICALYTAVVKNIRHSRGYPFKEYINAFRRRFRAAFPAGVIVVAACIGLVYLYMYTAGSPWGSFSGKLYIVVVTVVLSVFFYLFPVLSRFKLNLKNAFMLSFIMCGRHFLTTLVFIVSSAVLVYLFIFILPIIMILFVPGIWMYLMSFLIEKVLRNYMPPPTEDDKEKWYYEQ